MRQILSNNILINWQDSFYFFRYRTIETQLVKKAVQLPQTLNTDKQCLLYISHLYLYLPS